MHPTFLRADQDASLSDIVSLAPVYSDLPSKTKHAYSGLDWSDKKEKERNFRKDDKRHAHKTLKAYLMTTLSERGNSTLQTEKKK